MVLGNPKIILMFSFLDILRRKAGDKPEGAGAASPEYPPVSVSVALKRELTEENSRLLQEARETITGLVRQVYSEPGCLDSVKDSIWQVLGKTIELLKNGRRESVMLFLLDYPCEDIFLYRHVANVCLLSLELGIALGYEPEKLSHLGMAAFLHDIGMRETLDLIRKRGELTEEERARVRQHPDAGMALLRNAHLPEAVFSGIRQEHERSDGSGYPRSLKEPDISDFARIIGAVDVYEALSHSRPYRSRFTPSETMARILKHKNMFAYLVVKILIERVGIFPTGSVVRLNTKEVAMVVKDNCKSPLRPVIEVIYDQAGAALKNSKEVDLSANVTLYIEECLSCFENPETPHGAVH